MEGIPSVPRPTLLEIREGWTRPATPANASCINLESPKHKPCIPHAVSLRRNCSHASLLFYLSSLVTSNSLPFQSLRSDRDTIVCDVHLCSTRRPPFGLPASRDIVAPVDLSHNCNLLVGRLNCEHAGHSQERERRIHQLVKDTDWRFGIVAGKRLESNATDRIPADSRERRRRTCELKNADRRKKRVFAAAVDPEEKTPPQ